MPAFSKMGVFPVGYFRATTQWLLRERRDVVARIDTIQAELTRIGEVQMTYQTMPQGDSTKASWRRTGFTVTRGSSLCRLMQAYIALGGNPYDISHFLRPDTTKWEDGGAHVQRYPGGGFVAPKTAEYNEPLPQPTSVDGSTAPMQTGYEVYPGGMVDSPRYNPGRQGGRLDRGAWDSGTVVRVMHDVRRWANQEIKTKLQNLEWQIIKLSDLAEQLQEERDFTLMEAFGGQLNGLPPLDDTLFDPRRLCQVLIADMYALIYETKGGIPIGFRANAQTGFLMFTFPDVPEDEAGPMG